MRKIVKFKRKQGQKKGGEGGGGATRKPRYLAIEGKSEA